MNDPKYIDANELRAMMFHGAFEEDSDLQRWDGGCWIRYKMFENALEQIGAADVVPVRRGRWVVLEEQIENQTFDECKCSECGCVEYFNKGWKRFNYCPNCGARMEGEAE